MKLQNSRMIDIYNEVADNFLKVFKFSGYQDSLSNNELKKALELLKIDDSGFLSLSILEEYFKKYSGDITLKALDWVKNRELCEKVVSAVKGILDGFSEDQYVSKKSEFVSLVERSLEHYDYKFPADKNLDDYFFKIIASKAAAIETLNNSEEFQISFGASRVDSLDGIKYLTNIFEWSNVESLSKKSESFPDGLSLHLIKNNLKRNTYYVFLVKNGENIYLISDTEKEEERATPHFYYKHGNAFDDDGWSLSKSPYRNKWEFPAHFFPYNEFCDKKSGLVGKDISRNEVVKYPLQEQVLINTKINELPFESILWVIFVFDQLKNKFFSVKMPVLPLSRTEIMNLDPKRCLPYFEGENDQSNVKCIRNKRITLKDIHTDSLQPSYFNNRVAEKSNWVEARYSHLVNEDMLNISSAENNQLWVITLDLELKLVNEEEFRDLRTSKFYGPKPLVLKTLNPSRLYTDEDFYAAKIFTARSNYVSFLELCAEIEYDEHRYAISEWFDKVLNQNKQIFFDYLSCLKKGNEEKIAVSLIYKKQSTQLDVNVEGSIKKATHIGDINEISDSGFGSILPVVLRDNSISYEHSKTVLGDNKKDGLKCALTGVKKVSHVFSLFFDQDFKLFIDFLGIKDTEIIEYVYETKYKTSNPHYHGFNGNLTKADPMLNLHDPFSYIQTPKVLVPLSIRGYNSL